jgi:monoamine oxidase
MRAERTKGLTRRQFLTALALAGGSGTALAAARSMGLVGPATFAPRGQVEGVRVIILGAGLAGMAAAYELGKLGYDCHLLEARDRAGGSLLDGAARDKPDQRRRSTATAQL